MNIVEVKTLHKSFKEVKALCDVNFEIRDSEIFGIIGPDGAGKTSLFRIIASLLLPDKGEVKVCGYDTVKNYKEIRKIIGYMPGRFSLYHDLSVEENLRFYAKVFGVRIEDNYDLIENIYSQIAPFRKRRAGALSGGMKQKLALSCAMIHRPKLLILDEPTTGVDAVSRNEFWDQLKEIKNEGITIIVSTPYMNEASLCDRVALIQNGKILSLSVPGQISSYYKRPVYSIRSKNSRYELLVKLRQRSWCHSAWLFGQELHIGLEGEDTVEVFEKEMKTETSVDYFQRIKPGIEDTFIELMIQKDEK